MLNKKFGGYNGGEKARLVCPRCESEKVWKDGKRKTKTGFVQIHFCRDCGYRFSEAQVLKCYDPSAMRQVCDSDWGSKNLTVATTENRATRDIAELKSTLFDYAWWHKKNGYAESTIGPRVTLLRVLCKRGADLNDPESVKETIAVQNWVPKRKINAVNAYNIYTEIHGIEWNPPIYRDVEKIPYVPPEKYLDILIADMGPKTSVWLQCLKETGMRRGELHRTTWNEIDFVQGTIQVIPEKGSRPRILKVSKNLTNRLSRLKATNNVKDPKRIWNPNIHNIQRSYEIQRANISEKHQIPDLNKIKFHTFRHWFATNLYHKTKNVIYVQRMLGHRSISNTMIYIHIEEALFPEEEMKTMVEYASNKEGITKLLEDGFRKEGEFEGEWVMIKQVPVG